MPQGSAAAPCDHDAAAEPRGLSISGNRDLRLTRRSRRRLAWLAILAIGLTAVMPTVSRVLLPSMPMAAMAYGCGPQAGQPMPDHGAPHGSPLDACGYCSLFCHVPLHIVVPPALVLAAPLMPPPSLTAMPTAPAVPSILAARPRGPPRIHVI